MILYLSGCHGRKEVVKKYMNLYLSGTMEGNQSRFIKNHNTNLINCDIKNNVVDLAILESFMYADEETEKMIPLFSNFILDSGAFTYMAGYDGSEINWEEYIDRYADFINRNNVENFVELDIDFIVGYERVKELRRRLIEKTGKKPIVVWHKSRGKEEFIKMCQEFPYVAIGGVVTKEISRSEYKFFPWFIKTAHQYGSKIHGLGLTSIDAIKKYHFDSVDSSSWTCGNRFGMVYKFTGDSIKQYTKRDGTRLSDPKLVSENNFNEWVKFQKYAKDHL